MVTPCVPCVRSTFENRSARAGSGRLPCAMRRRADTSARMRRATRRSAMAAHALHNAAVTSNQLRAPLAASLATPPATFVASRASPAGGRVAMPAASSGASTVVIAGPSAATRTSGSATRNSGSSTSAAAHPAHSAWRAAAPRHAIRRTMIHAVATTSAGFTRRSDTSTRTLTTRAPRRGCAVLSPRGGSGVPAHRR
jgi:hypothetical protein